MAGSGPFAATAKVRGKRVDLVDVGGIAGLHGLLQARLVEERTVGDDRSSDGNEDTAANVANEVDDSGDLVARFFWKSDISRLGDSVRARISSSGCLCCFIRCSLHFLGLRCTSE